MIDDPKFDEAIEQAVKRIEKRTDAEIVVVAAERSGHYRDVQMQIGGACTLALLAALFFAPIDLHPIGALIEVALAFPLFSWLAGHRAVVRLVTPAARQRAQARLWAEAEFVREAVHGTPNHTGVLVYASALEQRVEVILDLGLAGRVATGELAPALDTLTTTSLDGFVAGLERLGDVLASHAPHTSESDAVDLPDAPRRRT